MSALESKKCSPLSESLLALRDDRPRPGTGVHCRHSADLLVSGDVVRSRDFFARLFQKTLIDQGGQGMAGNAGDGAPTALVFFHRKRFNGPKAAFLITASTWLVM